MRPRLCRGMAKLAMAGKLHWRRSRRAAALQRRGALKGGMSVG
jgi:hypothetical protein